MQSCAFTERVNRISEEDWNFLHEVAHELDRARVKFPSSNLSMAGLVEEVGELAQAMLKVRAGKWTAERIFQEAVQVATMALRVAVEGDASFQIAYEEPA